jgi:TRAP-type mannitol/chloroaromatic compound transport system permease small subunit
MSISHAVDTTLGKLATITSYALPAMMLVTGLVVILRYAFDSGSVFLQESVTYLHAMVFMLGIPYTLGVDEHVRVDIFYARFSNTWRNRVNLCGHLFFLMPLCLTILVYSWQYTLNSWHVLEGSAEVGGVPAVFLLKSLIPINAVLLLTQGVSEILKCVQSLKEASRQVAR